MQILKKGFAGWMAALMAIAAATALAFAVAPTAEAATTDAAATDTSKLIYFKTDTGANANMVVIGKYNDQGQIEFQPMNQANAVLAKGTNAKISVANSAAINQLVQRNETKTIVFPKNTTINIDSPIMPTSNTTIIAEGATINVPYKKNGVWVDPKATNYKSFSNLTIIGGDWKYDKTSKKTQSMFALAHGSNITLDGITTSANYASHAIEIMACKDVVIKNCKVTAGGSCAKTEKSSLIQIDVTTKAASPHVAKFGAKYIKGQTCKNVTIENCTVKGARAVATNYDNTGKFKDKFHSNINLINNDLEGKTAEAVSLFNVIGAKVKGNTIVSKSKSSAENYSRTVGIYIGMFGKAPAAMKKSTIEVSDNTIKGNRNCVYAKGYFNANASKVISKLGTVKVENNKMWCKKGKKYAADTTKIKSVKKWVVKKNKIKKW